MSDEREREWLPRLLKREKTGYVRRERVAAVSA